MPELPEVETLRRSLTPHLIGRRFAEVSVHDTRLRTPVDVKALRQNLPGRGVVAVERRGKYLLIMLERGDALVVHLGMSGRMQLVQPHCPRQSHEHVVFTLDDGRELRFRDPRRFGLVEWAKNLRAEMHEHRHFRHLGVEPLSKACTAAYLFARSRAVAKPIKNFIMDGAQLVGVGNIYASESLYLAGIHPKRAAGSLTLARWQALTKAIKQVLRAAIRQGGTTLNDFQDAQGNSGYFQVKLRVYDRRDQSCNRCGKTIRVMQMSGRSTYYCPGCQR